MVNSLKLKGRLVELGLTQSDLAKALNLATSTISQKLNNIRPMSLKEAEKICEYLKISDVEFYKYFFNVG